MRTPTLCLSFYRFDGSDCKTKTRGDLLKGCFAWSAGVANPFSWRIYHRNAEALWNHWKSAKSSYFGCGQPSATTASSMGQRASCIEPNSLTKKGWVCLTLRMFAHSIVSRSRSNWRAGFLTLVCNLQYPQSLILFSRLIRESNSYSFTSWQFGP